MLSLTSESREGLKFWTESIEEYNAQPIWHSPSAVRCVYSDASEVGYGGYIVEHDGMHVAHGIWSTEEAKQSSTWRELVAVGRVVESFAGRLSNTECVGSLTIKMLYIFCRWAAESPTCRLRS